jgi:murein DD-endopeptidase MepM/ murein hydrolase activator NlpD
MRVRFIFLTAGLLIAGAFPLMNVSGSAAVGGPPIGLGSEERRESLLREHFASLEEEEHVLMRERRAVRRALVSEHGKGGRKAERRIAFQQRMRELSLKLASIEESRLVLLTLERDGESFERILTASYEGREKSILQKIAQTVQLRQYRTPPPLALSWPVHPAEGLSAGFRDVGYEKRFGIAHDAIDIPIEQETVIRAPADGMVASVHDRGYGYNTIVLTHEGGVETLYGHVSAFLVKEGDRVNTGDPIALSGGRPGSNGAGLLTTGPHLHFAVLLHGQAIDPLYYLSPMEVAISDANGSVIPAM